MIGKRYYMWEVHVGLKSLGGNLYGGPWVDSRLSWWLGHRLNNRMYWRLKDDVK